MNNPNFPQKNILLNSAFNMPGNKKKIKIGNLLICQIM